MKAPSAAGQSGTRCDAQACVVETAERRYVSFILKPTAFAEDCRRAEVIVTALKAPSHCKALVVLDRDALAARGATTLRVGDDRIDIRSVLKGRESIPRNRLAVTIAAPVSKLSRAIPEQDFPDESFIGESFNLDGSEDAISSGAPD